MNLSFVEILNQPIIQVVIALYLGFINAWFAPKIIKKIVEVSQYFIITTGIIMLYSLTVIIGNAFHPYGMPFYYSPGITFVMILLQTAMLMGTLRQLPDGLSYKVLLRYMYVSGILGISYSAVLAFKGYNFYGLLVYKY